MTFSHYFDHNFISTNNIWVKFVSLESGHLGLQFEHKFFLILSILSELWTFEVGSLELSRIRVCVCLNQVCVHTLERCVRTLIFWAVEFHFKSPNIILWCGPAPRPLGTSKDILKALKTHILTYKYSPYVSNQNPS